MLCIASAGYPIHCIINLVSLTVTQRLSIPGVDFGESLHGTLVSCGAPYTNETSGFVSTGCATSFPHLLMLGSTLNRSLWKSIGNAIGDEDRALHNQAGLAGSIFWTPNVNLVRDPRWGRNQVRGRTLVGLICLGHRVLCESLNLTICATITGDIV